MFFDIVLIICTERWMRYMSRNKKRFLGAALTVLVFLVSNSFSAPAFQSGFVPEAGQNPSFSQAAAPEQPSENVDELLYEGDFEHYAEASENQYSVDEILGDSNSQEFLDQQNNMPAEQRGYSKDDWNLILINKQHPVPEDYTFELGTITANMQLSLIHI